jgi:hypothetical protein
MAAARPGGALCEALIAADRSQEVTRASALPKAVADFYVLKAELYTGLKMINDAGHELYASNPLSSSRFNLSLLHRRHVPGTTAPEPARGPAMFASSSARLLPANNARLSL